MGCHGAIHGDLTRKAEHLTFRSFPSEAAWILKHGAQVYDPTKDCTKTLDQ